MRPACRGDFKDFEILDVAEFSAETDYELCDFRRGGLKSVTWCFVLLGINRESDHSLWACLSNSKGVALYLTLSTVAASPSFATERDEDCSGKSVAPAVERLGGRAGADPILEIGDRREK